MMRAATGSGATLRDLVAEARADERAFSTRVRVQLRSSYSHHYRRGLPKLLKALRFRCNNTAHRPVMDALDRPLLLVLFGLGTNMGIKRVADGAASASCDGGAADSEAALRRVRRLFINRDNLRGAIRHIVNETWPPGMSRYGGTAPRARRTRVCIYSQVTSCSASEVAAMIEGLLRHLTTAEIERNYRGSRTARPGSCLARWAGDLDAAAAAGDAQSTQCTGTRHADLTQDRHRRPPSETTGQQNQIEEDACSAARGEAPAGPGQSCLPQERSPRLPRPGLARPART